MSELDLVRIDISSVQTHCHNIIATMANGLYEGAWQ